MQVRYAMTRRCATAVAVVLVVSSCVAPSPPPELRPQPDGQGRVPGAGVVPSQGCDDDPVAEVPRRVTVDVDGTRRTSRLATPGGVAPTAPAPLLVSLHPFSTTSSSWEQYSRLARDAARRGYIVVSPTGSDPGPRWAVPGGLELSADDLSFIDVLVEQIQSSYCVDRNRVVAAGFSAGAAMAQALSCTSPWRFAAVAGAGGMNLTDLCPESPPTDVMVLHGTADPIAPASGSTVPFAPPLGLSIESVVATNEGRAGCSGDRVTDQFTRNVVVERSTGCPGAHRVEYWRLVGGGHTWPGTPRSLLELVAGPTITTISANEVILDFFDAVAT